ncbi:MAG: response regulator transcription factor [Rhodococcus sp. (in: high G+C Gram-positive bacteria)]
MDDDPNVLFGVRIALETDGHRVVTAADGRGALAAVAREDPDAVVLDLSMPFLDGVGVCRTLRAAGDDVPVLMLTAHDRPTERVTGLDAGADDYLGKPFDVSELRARVRALTRRRNKEQLAEEYPTWRGVALDIHQRRLICGTDWVNLTRTETIIADLLFRDANRVSTRDELIDAVWRDGSAPASNALDVAVAGLRKKIVAFTNGPAIRAVRGLGYRLAP